LACLLSDNGERVVIKRLTPFSSLSSVSLVPALSLLSPSPVPLSLGFYVGSCAAAEVFRVELNSVLVNFPVEGFVVDFSSGESVHYFV